MTQNNFFSFSPCHRRNAASIRQDEYVFEERQQRPVETETPQPPGPSEPTPVNRNVIRPKSVGELTEMVAGLKPNTARRPSAGPSRQAHAQGDGGHGKTEETTVAFGRTTKLKDTIQGVKPVAHGSVRPLIGTAKEVENLKKTIEVQQSQINQNEADIAALRATCESQRADYVELLNTCDSLMFRMSALEKKLSGSTIAPATKTNTTNDGPSTSTAFNPRIMDSVALVKANKGDDIPKRREVASNRDNDVRDRENVPPLPPVPAPVPRNHERNALRRQKRKDELNGTLEKLNLTHHDDRYQENRYRGHNNVHHDDYDSESQRVSGRYKEKVTYKREFCYSPGRNADGPYLSTTIESTLRRGGSALAEPRATRPRQQYQHQRYPQIEEAGTSEDETELDDDSVDYRGHNDGGHNPVSGLFVPPGNEKRLRDDDANIQYTCMPDQYGDELEDFESEEAETPPPPAPKDRIRAREKVADRLGRHRHN